MSYATETDRVGKEPFIAVGYVRDKCSLTAGASPCVATQTGDAKCYNTRATCNDPTNYTKTTQEIKFCEPRSNLPIGENIIPALSGSPMKAATSITAGKGLGKRAVVKINIKDFPHHDRGIDPYYSERTYNAETTGTFWPRELKRNPYYEGRTLKIYYGYIAETFSWSDFDVQEYDITDIDGPDNGMIQITAKDILIRTYKEKAQYPEISNGKLLSDITASAATATLTPTGIGSEYPASGTVAIGKEAKTFTRSGDVLTFTAHGQWGTTDVAHSADDVVQLCVVWSDTNVIDALYELLVTGAGLPASYIPYDNGATGINENWDDEKELWLSGSKVNGIIMKPEGIEKVIGEFTEQFMFDVWWNATNQEVNIKALSPEPSGVTINTLTEGYNILADSVKVKRESKKRHTEIQVWYGKIDYSDKDEIENYALARISADANKAGSDQYNQNSIKVILCRWINTLGPAAQLSGRTLARYSDTPEIIEFEVSAKDHDKFEMAGRVGIDYWKFQGFSGANDIRKYQITEIKEADPGHSIKVIGLTSSFSGRYWFIAQDGTPDYSSATEAQKNSNGFICYDTGVFLDGEEAYKII